MSSTQTTSMILPPAKLLSSVTNPTSNQQEPAFPLQTNAWLAMQAIVSTALEFPLSEADFERLYGKFSQEGTIEGAVKILGAIHRTGQEYGDPETLISSLPAFQQAATTPPSIYGGGVWLAAQTQLAAQQIVALLEQGLIDIGQTADPQQRMQELIELLIGDGGINSYATRLQGHIEAFQTAVSAFYTKLNGQLNGQTDSLAAYRKQEGNALDEARSIVKGDKAAIEQLAHTIAKLNEEYIGFVVAASSSPVFLVIPFFGILLTAADATTFGVLATKVKDELDKVKKQLASAELDEQQKAGLVIVLEHFNDSIATVAKDGQLFLEAIATMIAGWLEFQGQIKLRLASLTVEDVENWGAFMDKLEFETAKAGWELIGAKAESFFRTGFVSFVPAPAGWPGG